ncbi:ATP-dependent RNA helicase SUPV3L1/SUV3 [Sphingomonas vulcanisoli]|uniref:ATP-dependent RNA helicase SUPV3L1/SUV3 n=1 Tax=Sphingomonas vulcanisoli TaxID=1658060 RepID=A0ABX0TVH1_9SPHN|nr:helicase-related protein [Sphingomonas vulcanisoli]NIJ09512.1 ATP-dependent RNA helicase SUPV3L1/SUV3 [Sphingomonas vulcanisoli]
MTRFTDRPLVAVLGPTNTGKTHLAVERMCGHSSGLIGFPLRLLAREVYDRVVAIKGKDSVALITGEEKVLPDKARWFLTTAESMPMDRDFAFVALDEAQLGADRERGHIFTDRILRSRGREETMLLGSDALRPMLAALAPEAEIITRPRFSTLTYAGPAKLSRLPKRSVIVAFSAEEVYAVAEMLRRLRGGAAVVMGALSPRTRNAQVAMFQAGEVDYLVATDAIGMGLNMDVSHVAFASLRKFDGRKTRRLTISEMAQIAGRAGRHQRDGTFGSLSLEGSNAHFEDEEVHAIEGHHIPPLDHLYWRDGDPNTASIDRLIADLERKPDKIVLRAAPEAVDLAVLKRLADEPWVRERAKGQAMVARLWDACGLPDFRKTGAEPHSRLIGRIFRHLSEGDRHIPVSWFADELVRLESVQGDVETLADRLAGVRTWAYIAHRRDWLADPGLWAERARGIEEKLSDALHQRLTQRFVDRRTSVLMRDLGARGADLLPMKVAEDGTVTVDGEAIGLLIGFRFKADPQARHGDMKRLMAAAERRLGEELGKRAKALIEDEDAAFNLATDIGRPVALFWRGDVVARLTRGKSLLHPRFELHRALGALPEAVRDAICGRLRRWLEGNIARHLAPLAAMAEAARDPDEAAAVRALLANLAEAGGVVARRVMETVVTAIDRDLRPRVYKLGIRLGTLDLFVPALIKPEPTRWRIALAAAQEDAVMPPLPPPGAVSVATPAEPAAAQAFLLAGFRPLGAQMLRVDQVEKLARAAHDARTGRAVFSPDPGLATSLGLSSPSFQQLMLALGFGRTEEGWRWRGKREEARAKPRAPRPGNAFGALAALRS